MRRRPRITAAIAAGICAAGLITGSPAAASSRRTTVFVAQGTAAPGATVQLWAWPADHVLLQLRSGQDVPRTLLATTTASSSGAYQIGAAPAALAASAVSAGYANLEVDSGMAMWFLTWRTSKAIQTGNPAGSSVTQTINFRTTGPVNVPCLWAFIKQLRKEWSAVGQGYVLRSRISQQFTYLSGQNSSLGVGVSVSGDFGTFHAGGTVSTASSQEEEWPGYGPSKIHYITEFKVGKYGYECPALGYVKYMVASDGYFGGANIVRAKAAPHVLARNCAFQLHGSTVHTFNQRAVEWKAGFDIAQVGFGASAQTGYDTSDRITYHFHRDGYECGSNNRAPADAPQIVAR